ncbi:hypothetical protein [Helicobacter ganmani]|uniref:hypothetical protein n=1 Tax=Helicobacter ganmani TaxID=60246 RepID=UPI0039E901B6
MEIPIYQALNARYIKISHQPIPLDFKVFIRKYSGLFISPTQAGWGDRMIAILNCMAMAKYTGLNGGHCGDTEKAQTSIKPESM